MPPIKVLLMALKKIARPKSTHSYLQVIIKPKRFIQGKSMKVNIPCLVFACPQRNLPDKEIPNTFFPIVLNGLALKTCD